jgi:hypothetical protein
MVFLQCLPFIAASYTASLSHRKPATRGTFGDSCGVRDDDDDDDARNTV